MTLGLPRKDHKLTQSQKITLGSTMEHSKEPRRSLGSDLFILLHAKARPILGLYKKKPSLGFT